MAMVRNSTPFCILVYWYIPCYLFDILAGFSFSDRRIFFWGQPLRCSALTKIWNVYTDSSMILSSLWNLTVFISSSRTLLLSWATSLIITVHYTKELRRLVTYGNSASKMAENEVGSIGFRYSPTPLQYGIYMSYYYSITHDRTDTYKSSIFSRLTA